MAINHDNTLLERYFQREHNAVTEVYKLHYEPCRRYALKMTTELDEHEIKDIYHQTLVTLEQKQYSTEFQLSSKLSTFVMGIFIKKMIKYLDKKRKRPQASSDLPERPEKDDLDPCQECLVEALRVMQKDKEGAECFHRLDRVYVQGFDQEQLSLEFGVTYGTFRNQISKCVKKLRALAKLLCPECYQPE